MQVAAGSGHRCVWGETVMERSLTLLKGVFQARPVPGPGGAPSSCSGPVLVRSLS